MRFLVFAAASVLFASPLAAQAAADGAAPPSGFAAAALVHDGTVIVGRTGGGGVYPTAGGVLIYRRGADGAWAEAARIAGERSAVGDDFGAALAAHGDRLAVGAPGAADGRGAVFVFRRGTDGWTQERLIEAEDGATAMGAAVALGERHVAMGAAGGERPGTVFVWRREGARWVPDGRLQLREGTANRLGAALAFVDGDLVVGAPGVEAVYIYRRTADGWGMAQRLAAPDSTGQPGFGMRVSGHRGVLAVSAPRTARGNGAVHLYRRAEGQWTPDTRLVPADTSRGLRFGTGVAVGADGAWIGAPGVDRSAGRAYLYRSAEGGWTLADSASSDGLEGQFGGAVAMSTDVAVIGATSAHARSGAAVILERGEHGWRRARLLEAPPLSNLRAVSGREVRCDNARAADFECAQVDLAAFIPVQALGADAGVILNDIWGWTDAASGREFALVGRSDGTAFVELTNPEAPVYLGSLPMTDGARANLWRDIKVYRDHAFIVADGAGAHGVQVFDLRRLAEVADPPVTFEATALYDGIHSAHNIVINEETGFAYVVGSSMGGETCGGGLHMLDIRDPGAPGFAGCFAHAATGRSGTGYSHDAQCVVYRGPDAQYRGREICFGANETALSIADVTDKSQPRAIAQVGYPNVAYAHQGWLSDDQRYFFMGDEGDEAQGNVPGTRTLIWDVADLDDPVLAAEYVGPTQAIDHNQYVVGDRLYQANLLAGLRVLDISDPVRPVELGYFDTVPYDDDLVGFGGAWSVYPFFRSGVIAVSSWSEGLFLVRYRPAEVVP